MDRKAVAKETLDIMDRGYYEIDKKRVEIGTFMEQSIQQSFLITPAQGSALLEKYRNAGKEKRQENQFISRVENISTVDAILQLTKEGHTKIGVLNFASAKNPGGGFINGAMAQEESLAASGTLYKTLIAHRTYYDENKAQSSMMYTDYGIYSPDVLFFRNGAFKLLANPAVASVLTMPAVNMGQVILKGEDSNRAEQVMRRRMKLVLTIFAEQGAKNLILGAYGCGVFRNDPEKVALWWKELLAEGLAQYFDSVFYAVFDRSKNLECINRFKQVFM